jgi:formamidopyrimidine-DNA glycosylase
MTGQLLVDPADTSAHSRFVFDLRSKDGRDRILEFRDMRKFGRLHFTRGAPAPRLAALGADAWRGGCDARCLEAKLRGRVAPLKAFLLDQRHLAGIGNIYADEILWWTRLSPLRAGGSLTAGEVAVLAEEIPRRLGEGVKFLGCTLSDFVDTEGRKGDFQNWLKAYGKQGQTCERCGSVFVRVIVAGRGTSYCPGCQH